MDMGVLPGWESRAGPKSQLVSPWVNGFTFRVHWVHFGALRTVATLKEHAFFEEIEDWRFAWGSQIIIPAAGSSTVEMYSHVYTATQKGFEW